MIYHIQFADKGGPDLELVTCSGHGKNGSLCILQVMCTCVSLLVYIIYVHVCLCVI